MAECKDKMKNILLTKFILLLIIFTPVIYNVIGWYDEAFVLFLLICFFSLKRARLTATDRKILFLLFVLGLLGIASNLNSRLTGNVFSILIDFFTLYKPILAFLLAKAIFTKDMREYFVKILVVPAKIYLILNLVLGITSQFIDIGLSNIEGRYGVVAYTFVFNGNMFPVTILCSILILSFSKISRSNFFVYFICSCCCLLLHTKGTFFLFIAYALFQLLILKRKAFKFKYLAFLIPLILLFGAYQIENYLNREDSVRFVLLSGGIKTAMNYFPFGSGFSTYGTNEASVNYSPLYYEYGYNLMWGLGEDEDNNMFLNDTYLAGIIAEEGFLGLLLFLWILMIIAISLLKRTILSVNQKITIHGTFLCLLASITATGIFKSVSGVLIISIMSFLICDRYEKNNRIVKV